LNAIGYSGIGYKTSGVRAIPLGPKDSTSYVPAEPQYALNGTYPLARVLYVYVNKRPNQPLPPLEREFFTMVLSKEGQTVVVRDGFVPMPAKMAVDAVASLTR
jgi:phosphate transport system substrate-binding protein